jgi:DNA-directed RNA polymerase subunit M/transcription elongation factor TFIIS
MAPIYGLLLAVKGEIKRVKLADNSTTLDQEALQRIIKKKTPLKELGNYVHAGHKITLFGWTSGKAGTENKHDLPPPLHESVVYSDILLIASKDVNEWTNPVNFTPDQYEKFYTAAMGGDDEGDEGDDESSDEETAGEQEEEEDEDVVKMSKKKQAAAEDGEPEDEGDDDESTSDDEEDDEDGENDEEVLAALEDDEEAAAPIPKRAVSKKKAAAAKTNLTTVQNTGRASQQKLLARPGFVEISEVTGIPKEDCGEQTLRNHVLTLIKTKLGQFFDAKDQARLESVVFDAALQDAEKKFVVKHFDNTLFKVCYMNSARRLLSNLDPTSYVNNTHLLPRLRNGDLDISHLATMNNMDYAPTLYTQLHERQLLREQRQLEGNKAMATDQFRCGRCGKRETTFYELQTRSADEPMTKFITCLNCNNHWRK